ncbi:MULTISPECIES: peptide ABC transporter substrate-binding protein [Lactobacillus]|nr:MULTISPECIES: peptide ABC transporter substrate-binding protein [Lactobacillus]MDM8281286.1 peptide ABC transporter substrate-binding protein [Lactobacillus gallinarum]PEG81222.1 peptide ABC transporter substrate-binding protein [Lactobacillus sp. UMNPBX17]
MLTVVSAATLAACSNKDSSTGTKQTLNWMTKSELQTLDLSKVTDATSMDQISNSMEGLYRLGKNSKVENALATKTEVSKDGKTWHFTLRKNTKWSNGDPVTAKDFVYSWRRTVDPKTASQYAYLFSGVKNADAVVAGKKKADTLGVKADDDQHLTVTLDRRIPYFKLLMGFGVFFPQNKHAVEKYGKNYGTSSKTMVYNGPFVSKGWTGSNLSWKLVKNNNYWDKNKVKLSTINYSVQKTPSTDYNLYQSGKLDAALLAPQATKQLKHQSGYTIRPASSTQYLQLNEKNRLFKNADFRRALSLSINRKALASSVGGANKPVTTFSPANMTEFNGKDYTALVKTAETDKVMTYNPALAKNYWKKAQKALGQSKVNFTLLTYDDDDAKKAGEYLQSTIESNLKGVSVKVNSLPKKTALVRGQSGNFDALLMGWQADFTDPISFLDLNTTNASYNWSKWANKDYDKYVAASKTTGNMDDRFEDLAKAERVLLTEQGVVPLYQPAEAWMVRPTVKNVVYNGAGANYNFKYAYVEK